MSSDGARRRHKLKIILARNVSRITRLQERATAAQEQLRAAEDLRHRLDAIEERMGLVAQEYGAHLEQAWVTRVSAAREQELALSSKIFMEGSVETMMSARHEVAKLRGLVDGARRDKRRSVDVCRWPICCVRTTFVAWGEVVLRTTLALRWCASWCGRRRGAPVSGITEAPAPRSRRPSVSLAQRRAAHASGPGALDAGPGGGAGGGFGEGGDEEEEDDGFMDAARSPRHAPTLPRRSFV